MSPRNRRAEPAKPSRILRAGTTPGGIPGPRTATSPRGVAGLLGLVGLISLTLAAGCTTTTGGGSKGSAVSVKAEVAHDKAVINRKFKGCVKLRLNSPQCPLIVATTTNGTGGELIAVDLTQQSGDDCYRGRVFFFDADQYLTSTRQLTPHSVGGVQGMRSAGTAAFRVGYGVSASANSTCAANGSAGTDYYIYAWDGARMVVRSGTPPKLPKVIVGA